LIRVPQGAINTWISEAKSPKKQSPKPKAQSPKPKAQSPKPKAQSPKPKAQSKNELHQELLPGAPQPAPPPLRRPRHSGEDHGRAAASHQVCQQVLLGRLQELLQDTPQPAPQSVCGYANILDVNHKKIIKKSKKIKKNQKKF
jgi:hypothetical protein